MTSPSASRPGHRPVDPSSHPAGPEGAFRAPDEPPTGSVSLAELIADTGPLPPDAALECVQRLAERLTLTPAVSCAGLEPTDVLIDDDGGVWLRSPAAGSSSSEPEGMDRLGRLLTFLVTGDGRHVADGVAAEAADLPLPLSTVAGRLFSRNGVCYRSYEELASDAALLRGVAPAVHLEGAARGEPSRPSPAGSRAAAQADEATAPHAEPVPDEPSGANPGLIAGVVAVAAAVAYAIWQWL